MTAVSGVPGDNFRVYKIKTLNVLCVDCFFLYIPRLFYLIIV